MAKLLRLLEQDCTLTHEQLASMTDMTVADVKAAIQRYEADKTILGYQAIVDWDRTDREAVTALIEVKVTPSGATALTGWPSASTSTTRWRASI